jgi:hypothetical protein
MTMTNLSNRPDAADGPGPPQTFVEMMEIPDSSYRTAIAIKSASRMKTVAVTFALRERQGDTATYAATCPRCHEGELIAIAELDQNGKFKELPACPALCLDCEDRLDAILEPSAPDHSSESSGRGTMDKYLKAMKPSWE